MVARKAVLLVALVSLVSLAWTQPLGGVSEKEYPADDCVKKIVADLNPELMTRLKGVERIEPISYRTQVVAGMNYFIKCRVFDENEQESYVHLRVYKTLKDRLHLSAIKKNLSSSQPLEYFTWESTQSN